jgi:hypothetical protein
MVPISLKVIKLSSMSLSRRRLKNASTDEVFFIKELNIAFNPINSI